MSSRSTSVNISCEMVSDEEGGERMKLFAGLIMTVVGILLSWWALNRAVAGHDFYNWIWVLAMFLAAFGIILMLVRLRLWMRS